MGDLPGGMVLRQCLMPYTRWSPNFTPLKTHQFEIDTHSERRHELLLQALSDTRGIAHMVNAVQ
jgi:hypothetical protein